MDSLLESVERKYSEIANNVATPLIIISMPDGAILYGNSAAEDLLGFDRDELKSRLIYEFMPSDKLHLLRALFFSKDLPERGIEHELIFVRKSKKKLLVDMAFSRQVIDDQLVLLITLHDITQIKKAQTDLIKANSLLEEKVLIIEKQNQELIEFDKTKTKFLNLITHELRTPVAAMLGIIDLISHDPNTKSEYQAMLLMGLSECKSLIALIENILDLIRLQSGKIELELTSLDLYTLVTSMVDLFKEKANKKQVEIIVESDQPLFRLIQSDAQRTGQIIGNILDNAIKFSHDGGKVTISLKASDLWIEVAIKDNGVGIPEKMQEQIFSGFSVSNNIDNHERGAGLGLPIARLLMTKMQGDLAVVSQKDLGTTVTLKFPRGVDLARTA